VTARIHQRVADINPKQGLLNLSQLTLKTIACPFLSSFANYSILSSISRVDLSSNQLSVFPLSLLEELLQDFQVNPFQYLNLAHNLLGKTHPASIATGASRRKGRPMFAQLTLDLSDNALNYEVLDLLLADKVLAMTSEEEVIGLILHHNPLKELSSSCCPSLHRCWNLRHLELQYCSLMSLDGWDLTLFPQLQYLDLSNNRLSVFPVNLEEARELEFLSIENNEFPSIPTYLGVLPKIKTLLIQGNPQKLIRTTIISQGSQKVIEYLKCRHPTPGSTAVAPAPPPMKGMGGGGVGGLDRDMGRLRMEEGSIPTASNSRPSQEWDRGVGGRGGSGSGIGGGGRAQAQRREDYNDYDYEERRGAAAAYHTGRDEPALSRRDY
ncbi:MAG: hypothetical protein K2X36_01915, partial [Microbacteriaceae bacterium]|nr:hypothetical protein [Microbacteriaceae bacterium]